MPDSNRYHVAAGSHRIDTQKQMTLEAYLGTCVGVAVYDPVAGIGGHLFCRPYMMPVHQQRT